MIMNTVLLEKMLKTEFDRTYKAMLARPHLAALTSIITMVPSNSASEKYAWLGDFPSVVEWVGDRVAGMISNYDYTIKNKDWVSAIGIHENELSDDQSGMILPRVQMMAQVLAEYAMELIANLLINGTTNLAYDGIAFFSNASGVRTIDNLLAGTGITLAQIKADISSARAAMMRFTGDNTTKYLGLMMDTIVCPPELEATFIEAVTSPSFIVTGEGGTTNPNQKWIKNIIALPELTDTTDWYGLCTGYPLRPFTYQERQAPRPQMDETERKRNKKIIFQADSRGNAGYTLPHLAVKVVNS